MTRPRDKRTYITPKQARILAALFPRSFGLTKRDLRDTVNRDGLGVLGFSAVHNAIRELRDRGFIEVESPLVSTIRNKMHTATTAGRTALVENLEVWRRIRANHEGE